MAPYSMVDMDSGGYVERSFESWHYRDDMCSAVNTAVTGKKNAVPAGVAYVCPCGCRVCLFFVSGVV